mmetsp:Transcript_2063/g.5787  ORF Transcript_2063/g.5787 Transcript_2063/m.5787 type:complete len:200 (+) Transcript_2063:870-1469(+)
MRRYLTVMNQRPMSFGFWPNETWSLKTRTMRRPSRASSRTGMRNSLPKSKTAWPCSSYVRLPLGVESVALRSVTSTRGLRLGSSGFRWRAAPMRMRSTLGSVIDLYGWTYTPPSVSLSSFSLICLPIAGRFSSPFSPYMMLKVTPLAKIDLKYSTTSSPSGWPRSSLPTKPRRTYATTCTSFTRTRSASRQRILGGLPM